MKTFNIEKYINALNDLLGVDHAYFSGDEKVDALVELIVMAKKLAEENNMTCKLCEKIWKSKDEYCESERYPWDEHIVITMEDGRPWLYVPCGDTWYSDIVMQINYCPVCGRKLTED